MSRYQAWTALTVALILSASGTVRGQGAAGHPVARNSAEMTFAVVPGLPTCAQASVQNGDPAKGPSILLAKIDADCSFPLHWHTATEHLMLVSGLAHLDAKGEKTATMRAGAFAMLPSRHVHKLHCASACMLYVYSDAPFDMHYVDAQGKELSPADALKAVKETPAGPPK